MAFGTGSGAGKWISAASSLQKQLDKSSPKLFLNCCTGTHIAKGTMIVREATGGDTTQIYYQYDMKEVFVDSISWGGAAGGGKPSESLSLSCKVAARSPTGRRMSTGKLGDKIAAGWDVSKNAKM